ncbi:cryptochrome/photolyase family protein [Ensifer soli]|uniref:cryptochrome/photolyase family protein n=1 Tax=Ciceribacter sp. sgz301302 TaxID=3342379 RepID=UPI0035B845A2
MRSSTSPAILWFRKDLRLCDNAALSQASAEGRPVVAVYIREPAETGNGPLGAAQAWWLHHSLTALAGALSNRGNALILRSGPAAKVIAELIRETGATEVCWNRRYDPHGIAVDGPLKQALSRDGVTVSSFCGQLLHEPSVLKTGSGGPYKVYSPFWRALAAGEEPPTPFDPPRRIAAPESLPPSETLSDWTLLPKKPDWAKGFSDLWCPGETGALARLAAFVDDGLDGYATRRDLPGADGTSMLSPHLALGEISPARLWHAVSARSDVAENDRLVFRKEVVWRDFSYHLLFHNPDMARRNLDDRFDAFPWISDGAKLKRWQMGRTGYPIVDAGMRQLWTTGYMHNRVRMIAASFLIKDLMIDWRQGEAWFRDTLVDADPASNAASWQWVAGCGADAAPFFRVFNPILQGEKFDPDGSYVKTHVPELAKLPPKYLHRPFEAPKPVLEAAGIVLGDTYPRPVVDHFEARDRALAAYQAVKDAA